MRYLMIFSYDGSVFNGFQRQKNKKTVQGEIEKVLFTLSGKKIDIHASGRTDTGVHALNQKAHFDLDMDIKINNLKMFLNRKLKGEIYIKDICVVDDFFHARYNVVSKTYIYKINTLEFDPFFKNYVYQYNKPIDIALLTEASIYFLGEKDFRSLCKKESEKENCVRCISSIDISSNDGIVTIEISANGFLRGMVRVIIGILLDINSGKKSISDINKILLSKSRTHNTKLAIANGLYLKEVNYTKNS